MITPNMTLLLPTVSSTAGPDWAADLNGAFTMVDSHDHSSGKGVKVTPSGLNINADLAIGGNNLSAIRSLRLDNQAGALSGGSDIRCIYSYGSDLYWNNGSGASVQITLGSALNNAAVAINIWKERAVAGNITISASDTDMVYLVDTTSARAITLPAANAVAAGRIYVFKDDSGTAGSNNITITRVGSDTIDKVSGNRVMSVNLGAMMIASDGVSNWDVLFASKDLVGDASGSIGANVVTTLTGSGGKVTLPSAALAFGATPALSGSIRVPSGFALNQRNAANSADLNLISSDGTDNVVIGTAANVINLPGTITGGDVTLGTGTGINSLSGGLYLTTRNVAGNITIDTTTTDLLLLVDTNSARTITLPAPVNGRVIIIKDKVGLCADHNITIARHASESIDRASASKVLQTAFCVFGLVSDGTNWFVWTPDQEAIVKVSNVSATVDSSSTGHFTYLTTSNTTAVTITLPSPTTGRRVTVKDVGGNAASHNVTVARAGGSGNIDGVAADKVISTNYGSVNLISNGIDWFTV